MTPALTLDPAPVAPRRRSGFARDCQILLALAGADYETAANLIVNTPFLDWRALVPPQHHDELTQYLRG